MAFLFHYQDFPSSLGDIKKKLGGFVKTIIFTTQTNTTLHTYRGIST